LAEQSGRPSVGESLFGWSEPGHQLTPLPPAGRGLDVADSWLVDDALVRGLRYHAERFIDSCHSRHGVAVGQAAEFLAAACMAVPRTGRWFPRVEFEAGAGFRLRLRPAPEPGAGVVVRRADGPDSRTDPTVKGPDLAMLIGLRQGAAAQGADEALLVSGSGTVLEGALSAVLWWRGDVLCAPPRSLPVLPSVTRRLLFQIASETETEVRFETCRTEDLDGLEVWTASALHGIRPVTSWSGERLTAAPARRASEWQARLIGKAIPVDQAVGMVGLGAISPAVRS
jgi:branched-subunit amino acid aminotransferase/4-amino-4-deoxychorismate lyase